MGERISPGLRAAFAKHGLSYGLIIGPDKHSIYPDFLPGWVNPVSAERTRTQDIAAIAREELATGFTDARPLLQARRAADPSTLLYHPTDTPLDRARRGSCGRGPACPLGYHA